MEIYLAQRYRSRNGSGIDDHDNSHSKSKSVKEKVKTWLSRLSFNAPITLTFSFLAIAVMIVDILVPGFIAELFSCYPLEFNDDVVYAFFNPIFYLRLVSHSLGHGSWSHLFDNLMLFVIVAPLLEEKYGSKEMIKLILMTALSTGLFASFFSSYGVVGSSDILFSCIFLASLTNYNAQNGEIPLTFVLTVIFYAGSQLFEDDKSVSVSSHLLGGICGAVFGYMRHSRSYS